MYRIPGVLSPATTPAQNVPPVRPTRGPPNDIVVRQLLAIGLHLQGALELLGDHPASVKIRHAADELDQTIREIREAIAGTA